MSDPQRPHGLQPTRLLHPWDFPGKSTAQLNPPFIQTVILKYLLGTTVKTTTNIYRNICNKRRIDIPWTHVRLGQDLTVHKVTKKLNRFGRTENIKATYSENISI